jgi:uridine kinase
MRSLSITPRSPSKINANTVKRSIALEMLAGRIVAIKRPHPVRVAIDGVDAAGKTSLADELVQPILERGRAVIRASIDGFHNPRAVRYRLGRSSPEGYFLDSFNYAALTTKLLGPLGPGGSRLYCAAVFDYRTDSETPMRFETAPPGAILLFDGVFLQRPELLSYWDLTVFVDAPFSVTVARMSQRDGTASSDVDAVENRRYVDGQRLYLQRCDPRNKAMVIFNNEDLASPELIAGINGPE